MLSAPPECRAEVNRTFQQYQYLGGMGSEMSFGVACTFFIRDHRCTANDVNRALAECRAPERMSSFRFAGDLMGFFAERVVVHRGNRERSEQQERDRQQAARETAEALKPADLSAMLNRFSQQATGHDSSTPRNG